MEKELAQLKEFHAKFDPSWQESPAVVSDSVRNLRARLMRDEIEEVVEAMEEGDIAHIAKELADVLYAVYGTIGAYGLAEKMEEIFTEVHESNTSKDVPEGGSGKAIKGESYRETDIVSILNK